MRVHVRIPHGCYVVEVKSPSAWRSIQLGFHLRTIPFSVTKYTRNMARDHKTISEADLLLIGSTNPANEVRMAEVFSLLGISP